MNVRLSEVGEYSQAVAENGSRARQVPTAVPMTAAKAALQTRGAHGLAVTEDRGQPLARLNGLGELVQVVT